MVAVIGTKGEPGFRARRFPTLSQAQTWLRHALFEEMRRGTPGVGLVAPPLPAIFGAVAGADTAVYTDQQAKAAGIEATEEEA